jgi:hypothetical protein
MKFLLAVLASLHVLGLLERQVAKSTTNFPSRSLLFGTFVFQKIFYFLHIFENLFL